jgi:hypothetical protein
MEFRLPFSSGYSPFYYSIKNADIPNQNWNNTEETEYDGNKEQYDVNVFLKQSPRQSIKNEGVLIKICPIHEREVGDPAWREEDWGLQIKVSECDIKHRPWVDVVVIIEMIQTTPSGSTNYNITISLDSTSFDTTPAVTNHGPDPGFFGAYYYRTGYDTDQIAFYSVTEILGTDITRGTVETPFRITTINRIVSITPASAFEPPTPD